MIRMFGKTLRVGIVTEDPEHPGSHPLSGRLHPPSGGEEPADQFVVSAGAELRQIIDRRFRGSLSIRQVDAGSCNACELEIQALNNPYYSIERFGVHFVASPRHADVLLVTGPVSRHMEAALRRTWAATPNPKWVIAAGDCAACGGEFGVSYASCGAVENVIPVDLRIPGCPPAPAELLRGILALMKGG